MGFHQTQLRLEAPFLPSSFDFSASACRRLLLLSSTVLINFIDLQIAQYCRFQKLSPTPDIFLFQPTSHQQGLTYMLYPGAVHSRFEHSRGVYWLASEAIDRLKTSQGFELESKLFLDLWFHIVVSCVYGCPNLTFECRRHNNFVFEENILG
ncbi:Metal-dependent phosphohydrolase [Forsythia ovata]|uniref:Metal-dependent phosphohydrolase n=1 Tax=Forsythia ovata TaxID=205694 RepID=A0ABD1R2H7_9LAMI